MKCQAEETKRELVKERVKNANLQKQLSQYSFREPDSRVSEMGEELRELSKCFEKSELIRKQQKTLINKMKQQMEDLQAQNDELRLAA